MIKGFSFLKQRAAAGVVILLSYGFLNVGPVLAGEKIAIECTKPGCHISPKPWPLAEPGLHLR